MIKGYYDIIKCKLNNDAIQPKMQEKTIIPTKDIQIVVPDENYDGLNKVTVEPINLQSKEVSITENGTTTISADENYDGLSDVNITVNVDSGGGEGSIAKFYNNFILDKKSITFNIFSLPELNTKNLTSMSYMFSNYQSLISVPKMNTDNVTDMSYMFNKCNVLKNVLQMNTSKVTNMAYMFCTCQSLIEIPQMDTSNVTNMSYMFEYCIAITTVPILNTSKVTNMKNMFSNCKSLSDDSLNNILQMCINATSYTGTKTLYYLGFRVSYYSTTKIQSLNNYQAFLDAGWTIGY